MYKKAGLVVCMGVLCIRFGMAQTTGTVSGMVRDASGGVVPGATVMVKNVETGITRTLATDAPGRYQALNLPPGNYEVEARTDGFQAEIRTGIRLTVGREAVVNFVLRPGAVAESVTVTGEAPLVDTTSAAVTGLVDTKDIQDLPLNARSFDQLVLLQVGAVENTQASRTSFFGGGAKVSISGLRPQQNAFLLDGSDVVDPRNVMPGSAAGLSLGVDTIREFRVLTNAYSAQYGRNAGATITAVTRSGTNELHGTLFEFHRNSVMDARDFFDRDPENPLERSDPPPFKRNQFGFTLGGPIRKDKTFFFGSYEGLRERLGATGSLTVPNADARAGRIPGQSPITVASSVKPYLDLYFLPNGRDNGDGTGEHVFSRSQPTNENYVTIRADHSFFSHHSLFGRYTLSDADTSGAPGLLFQHSVNTSRNQYFTLGLESVLSPLTLNSSRASFNRSVPSQVHVYDIAFPQQLSFVPGVPFEEGGQLSVSGLNTIGNQRVPLNFSYNLWEFGDDVTHIRGAHTMKAGIVIKRIQHNKGGSNSRAGNYSFRSGLTAFLQGVPSQFLAQVPGKGFDRSLRMTLLGFYVQDDFKVRQNLTLNVGLREEFMTSPTEVYGRCSTLPDVMLNETTVGCPYFETSKNNGQPRVGFAWDTAGSGRLVLRGGFGLFHDQPLPGYWYVGPTQLPPFSAILTFPGRTIPFPNAFAALDLSQPVFGDLRVHQPSGTTYAMQYNLTLQGEIFPGTGLSIGYIGSQARKLVRTGQENIKIPVILPDGRQCFNYTRDLANQPATNPSCPNGAVAVRNPTWGTVQMQRSDANSNYNGLAIRLDKRFRRGLQAGFSYTFSKNMSDAETVFGADGGGENAVMDPYNARLDRAPAHYSVKHNVSFNYSYELPVSLAGRLGKALHGWQMSGITKISSGSRFTADSGCCSNNGSTGGRIVERPDLAPAASNNPVEGSTPGCGPIPAGTRLGSPDRYFDPCAFALPRQGFYGTAGRNTIVGPGVVDFDFSLLKNTAIGERLHVQFRAEFFNLFNRANFGIPSNEVFNASGDRQGTAGVIEDTVTTSREIQLGLKFVF